jgi:hypothetical protein
VRVVSLSRAGFLLVLPLLLAPPARAEQITWGYNWSESPRSVAAVGAGAGGINFTTAVNNNPVTGSSDVVAANMTTFSAATTAAPDRFTGQTYNLKLIITDLASGKTGLFTFTGRLFGSLTASSASVTSTFASPLIETERIGNNVYTVTIGPFAGPGAPNSGNSGSIGAHVEVRPEQAPEPSALILAGLGTLGVLYRRRRRG